MSRPLLAIGALALAGIAFAAWRWLEPPTSGHSLDVPAAAASHESRPATELAAAGASSARASPSDVPTTVAPAAPPQVVLTIRGRVVAADGTAIAGAEVSLPRLVVADPYQSFGSDDEPVARSRSAPDGAFVLEVAAPAAPFSGGDVACAHAGFAVRERPFALTEGQHELDVGDLVLVRGATLRGFVRDREGLPIADARIQARTRETDGTQQNSTRSRAGGSFEIVDAPSGRVEVSALLDDGRRSVDPPTVEVEVGGTLGGIELVVPIYADPNAILGLVLDVDGSPLAGATVMPTYEKANGDSGSARLARTDARGRFRVQGMAGAVFRLTAEHPRGAAVAAHAEGVEPGRHDVVLRLTEARTARLRVRDPRGTPIERFAFRVRVQDGPVTRDGATGGLAARASGEVELALPGAAFVVELAAPGHASSEVGPFDPTALPAVLEAVLQPLPALRGRVVRRGEPVAGATVRAQADIERDRYVEREGFALIAEECRGCPETKADADGAFVLDVGRAGDWWLCAQAAGDTSSLAGPFAVSAGAAATEVVLDLGPRGAIEGRVRHANGRAISGRDVRASCGDGALLSTKTAEDGSYRFDVAPGSWQVRLRDPEPKDSHAVDTHFLRESDVPQIAWDCRVTDGATARCDIVVPEPARLVVRIAATAADLAGARWTVRASRERRAGMAELVEARAGERAGEHVLELPAGGEWKVAAGVDKGGLRLDLVRTLAVPPGASDLVWNVANGSVRGRLRPEFTSETRIQLAGRLADGTSVLATIGVAGDGAFEFPFAITGRYGLMIVGNRDRRTIVVVTAGQTVDADEF